MRKIQLPQIKIWTAMISLALWLGCDDFLETQPYGTTTLNTLSRQQAGAEALLIAAYSNLDGISIETYTVWMAGASNWVYGSIAGGDAYKGSDEGDQKEITAFEIHTGLEATNPFLEAKWTTYYNGVARANDALKAFKALNDIKDDFRNKRLAEARFLRGLYHFELWKLFRYVPYIDENVIDTRIGNEEDILPMIQDDFLFAANVLPLTQNEPGRITKGAAQAYFGISKMWEKDWNTAKTYFDSVIHSGRYALNVTYHKNFNAAFPNTPESILEVQQSVNDGANGANGNFGDVLNHPFALGSCCGFHQPSQNLVNAFRTDDSGLPMFDTYNDEDVANDDGLTSDQPFTPHTGPLDPRLDWTVGRRGLPFLDWGVNPGGNWVRDQHNGGPYLPIKNVIYMAQVGEYSNSGWNSVNANNLKLLRYAGLLLYAAEADVELGLLDEALSLINLVRARAANKEGFLKSTDGVTDAANYVVSLYPSFPDQNYARKAVRFERRLELGMEGHRFFDLVRWGIAAEEKNKYFEKEKLMRTYMQRARFDAGKNELLPIPQKAIDLSNRNGEATLEQNIGY
jgi:hypothetical protein